ncbi:hypothetical protein [Halorarius litoreus]|uniref:hypothetical protein n=1 Tax=Halorarius litoreus TaxID=2962676 RepID=UPI0020CDD5AD|nr:hypothetical protein [Halorarius litoreus]
MPATAPDSPVDDPGAVDPETVAARLREWAATHRERELERALHRLDAENGELTDGQRAVVAALSRSLTDELLAPPLTAVEADEAAAAYVAALFDLDGA